MTDGLMTDGRTENRTPISHPATSRCDNKLNANYCNKVINAICTNFEYHLDVHDVHELEECISMSLYTLILFRHKVGRMVRLI